MAYINFLKGKPSTDIKMFEKRGLQAEFPFDVCLHVCMPVLGILLY